MTTSFPTSLDSYTRPLTTDPLNSPSHAGVHDNAYDAIEALEAKVGIDGSAVTTSLDYQMENHAHTGGADDGGQVSHADLGSITATDHHSNANDHAEAHTVASHSDTTATGAELETLTDGSNADALHAHAAPSIAHADTTGQTATDHHDNSNDHVQSHDHSAAGDGNVLSPATFNIPSATAPAQTAEGQAVWDSDDDHLTVGDGTARVTVIDDGTAAGGELAGTYPNPTVAATHAGSAHHSNANDHAEAHTVASHSDTTATGAELETLTDGSNADALHAHASTATHASTHSDGGSDEVTVENLATASVDVSTALRPNGTGGLAFSDVAHGDLTGVGATDHHDNSNDHAESHTVASHSDTTATGAELDTLTDGSETTLHKHIQLTFLGPWTYNNIPQGASNVEAEFNSGATEATRIPVPYAGELRGLSVWLSGAVTAGTLVAKAVINGTIDGTLNTQLDTTNTRNHSTTVAAGAGISIAADDVVAVQIATGGAFAPDGTEDVVVALWFAADGI